MSSSYGDSGLFSTFGNSSSSSPYGNSGSFGAFGDGSSSGSYGDDDSFNASGDGKTMDKSNININLEFFGKEEFGKEEWGDDEDSGWDDDDDNDITKEIQNLKNKELKLEWKEKSKLEKIKHSRYIIGKTLRSSYYEKYELTSLFTKAAVNTKKITSFFKVSNQATIIQPDEISSNSENKIINKDTYQIDKRIRSLKE